MKRLFRGVTIATDRKGVTKLRFCENVDVRLKHMRKTDDPRQGFVIHDVMRFPNDEAMTKDRALVYMLEHISEFTHSDAKQMVEKALSTITKTGRFSTDAFREYQLKLIASRPKRDTDITTAELDKVLDNL